MSLPPVSTPQRPALAQQYPTAQQATEWFAYAYEALASFDDPHGKYDYAARLRDNFRELESALLRALNSDALIAEDWAVLASLLHKRLPKLLTRVSRKAIRSGPSAAWHSLYYGPGDFGFGFLLHSNQNIFKRISRIERKQASRRAVGHLATMTPPQLSATAPARELRMTARKTAPRLTFPSGAGLDESLLIKVIALRNDWQAAQAHPLTAAEHFRLEQQASTYLPDSLAMHAKMRGADYAVQTEGRRLLTEQLALLHAQVRQINARHSGDVLTAMRAQSAFLGSISAEPQAGRLELPPGQ